MSEWIPVTVESPYGSDDDRIVFENEQYAREAYHDCLVFRKEAPFASHLNYTQPNVLDDRIPEERTASIEAGLAIGKLMSKSVFYVDRGFSRGMKYGLAAAIEVGRPVEFRAFEHPQVFVDSSLPHRASVTLDPVDIADGLGIADQLHNILIVNGDERAQTQSPGCP